MGLSHAAAGGVLFLAATLAGFQISDDVFDNQDRITAAWDEFYATHEGRAATAFTIDDVRNFGASRTEITLTNTGSTTVDASTLTILYDGVPEPAVSWTVDTVASDVWAPASELIITTGPLNPDDVVVMDALGIKAYWRK